MSNDSKETVVDLSKLIIGQSSQNISTVNVSVNVMPSLITSYNEGTDLIGHELFTYNESSEK